MKVLNLTWLFKPGGVGKCFLTYSSIGDVVEDVEMISVCIDALNQNYDREPLKQIGARIIPIMSAKDLSWIDKIYKLLIEIQPDVIFAHALHGPILIETVRLLHKDIRCIPTVYTYHGLYHAPNKVKKPIEWLLNHLQTWLYKHYAKRVVLVENYSRKYMVDAGVDNEKIVTVHNGLPPMKKVPKPVDLPEGVVSIGLASRMDHVKGVEYMLDAVPLIKAKASFPFHVYILGNGPLEQMLRKKSTHMEIDDVVSFLGYQNNIPEWLAAWDIFALPSLFEYHSIALLEAMRAGKAIVATSVGGNEESVTHNETALVVPCRDSIALAESLIRFVNDKELRLKMGKAAKDRFETTFLEEYTKKNIADVLRSVCK